MNLYNDLTPLEQLLRSHLRKESIHRQHKNELRERLLQQNSSSPSTKYLLWSCTLVLFLAIGFYRIMQINKPAVGIIYSASNPAQHDVLHSRRWIDTCDQSQIVQLVDQSKITLSPHTRLQILSRTTDRTQEAARIYLQKGSADISVPQKQPYSFFVLTPDVTVRVTGTQFKVEVKTLLEK